MTTRESWDGKREYEWQGRWYPSVTTILDVWPKPFLAPWAAKETALRAVNNMPELTRRLAENREDALKWLKAARFVKSDAGKDIGSIVHAKAEAMSLGIDAPITDEVAPFVPQLEAWHRAYRPCPVFVEQRVFNLRVGYGGRFDLIADIYGERLLIDYKTTKLGIDRRDLIWNHHDWRLQVGAYGHGEFIVDNEGREHAMPYVDGYAVLHIPNDSPEQWRFIRMFVSDREWRTFRAAKALYDYVAATEKAAMGEPLLPQMEEAS